jgi:outer membrane protein TolC
MSLAAELTVTGLALFLTGCTTAPTPKDSATPWRPPAHAAQQTDSWATLRASLPDTTQALTLPELVDMALINNPASRRAWSAARAAAAQVEQARGVFMPTVTGVAAGSRQRTDAEDPAFEQDFLKYGPGLEVNYLILSFGGGRKAAVEAALQTVYATDYTFNRTIQDVMLAVETAYYGVISAEAGITAAEAGVKDTKTALSAAQSRLSAGVGTELEVLQAQTSADQSLYVQASAEGQLKNSRGLLAQAVGLPADTPLKITPPARDLPDAPPAQDLRKLIDEALLRRPDIIALRATLAARQATATAVGSQLWPSLYFKGSANRNYYENDGSKTMQDEDTAYFGGLSLQWTLFDGFQTLSARRVARAQTDAAEAQLKQSELLASAEIWARYHGYETAIQKHRFSTAFLKSANATHAAALDSYKGGLKSMLDLLSAETQLAQARSQAVTARQEVFTALANLAHATGLLSKGGTTEARDLFSNPVNKEKQK